MGKPLQGQLHVMQRLNRYEFGVEIRIMRSGVNRNDWDYRNVEENYRTFAGQPILTAYVAGQVGDGHNSHRAVDPDTGEIYNSYTGPTDERIVGTISEDPNDIFLEERDGETWIVAKGRIWWVYSPELVDKIVRKGRMEVSAETDVLEEHREGNIDVFTRWNGIGVTILGDAVAPAIPGANIKAAGIQEAFNSMKRRVAALVEKKNAEVKPIESLLDRRQCEALEQKFSGYTVLAAAQVEFGTYICLMAKDGSTATYVMGREEETVAPERIKPCSAKLRFVFNKDNTITISTDGITSGFVSRLNELRRDAKQIAGELNTARDTIRIMQEQDKKREMAEAKAAAESELAEINANRAAEKRFAHDIILPVLDGVEKGKYNAVSVVNAVRAAAMEAQVAQDKAAAAQQKKAEKKDDWIEQVYRSVTTK